MLAGHAFINYIFMNILKLWYFPFYSRPICSPLLVFNLNNLSITNIRLSDLSILFNKRPDTSYLCRLHDKYCHWHWKPWTQTRTWGQKRWGGGETGGAVLSSDLRCILPGAKIFFYTLHQHMVELYLVFYRFCPKISWQISSTNFWQTPWQISGFVPVKRRELWNKNRSGCA